MCYEKVNHEHILMKQFRFHDIFNDIKSTPISFNSSITCHGRKIITIKNIYKIVYPRWFYKWFQFIFWSMWTHCSRSCSTFSIMFVFYILTFNVGKTIWRHMFHCDWWNDLSSNCSHINYSIEGYSSETF
jgi:hypothetical protein